MSKDKIADYDGTTAGNNTDIGGISIAEGMLPSAVNNSMRELTKQLGAFANGTDAIDALTVTGAATVNGAFTSPGIDDNADATAITIDSSERVGIGTSSPQELLHLNDSSSPAMRLTNSTTGTGSGDGSEIMIADADNTLRIINHEAAHIRFDANGSERMRILSGGGITFNGDTAAANALDDYEEGTFTPTFTQGFNSPAFNTQTGRYTKIGNRVFFELQLDKSSGAANTSHVYVGGLPFNSAGDPSGAAYFGYNGGFEGSAMTLRVLTGTNQIALYFYSNGGAVGGNDIDDSAADFIISGFYAVA